VRDCASFGLPTYVRVAPRRWEDNARLLAAWKELLCRPPF
jgi:histidinol-phosphate aminotransferase